MLGLNAWISMDIDIAYHLFSFLGHFHWCQGVKGPILLAAHLREKREHFMFVIYLGHPMLVIYFIILLKIGETDILREVIKIGFGWSLGPRGSNIFENPHGGHGPPPGQPS